MNHWFRAGLTFCALGLFSVCLALEPPDDENANEVRPTGVPPRQHAKAKSAATTKPDSDADSNATPRPRRARRVAKSRDADDDAIPTQTVPGSVPNIGASSVIVIDVHSGQVLYEKNPDQIRAPASTTKLLTGLIVAETGNLDRSVTVAQVDTLAEPVKLNIKPGDIYQRIDLLRALLVKSPNDVARCLARDNAGSIEAFAVRMNQRARCPRGDPFALGKPKRVARRTTIFHCSRPGHDCTRSLRKPDNSLHRLSAPAGVSLCEWPNPRTRKHEQAPKAIALLQWHEDRLHRSRREMSDCQRLASGQGHYRRRAGRQSFRCLARRRQFACVGAVEPIRGIINHSEVVETSLN